MKKSIKTVIIVLVIFAVIGLCIGGYFIWRHNNLYIGKNAAIDIALTDAGLSSTQVHDVDVSFEKDRGQAWYEVEFKTHALEYEYIIDAANGSILHSSSEPD